VDRFYTPQLLAQELLSQCESARGARRVVDPSCGSGSLLTAAESVLGEPVCVGIDIDRMAIRVLRERKPHWCLSVADLLSPVSVRKSHAWKGAAKSEFVLLNPPFSLIGSRFVEYSMHGGEVIRVGRAMRFLLEAVDVFARARGMLAIVPESLFFSDLDEHGRRLIAERFSMREIACLRPTTFSGARVRAIAVELSGRPVPVRLDRPNVACFATARLERGTLPVHLAGASKAGVPFVHSVDLRAIANRCLPARRVPSGRHVVAGWTILLPRVGLPNRQAVRPVFLRGPVRFSDCVIALWFSDARSVNDCHKVIDDCWVEVLDLYRGTGARYVTVSRLAAWLTQKGLSVEVLK